MEINIKKRNGQLVPFDAEKINETIEWACSGLKGVSPSLVAMSAQIQFYDGMPSADIQKLLVKSAANLINEQSPDYQYVAGRLLMFDLRKEVFGTFEPDDFYEHISNLVKLGKYDKEILDKWTQEEIDFLGEHIVHERDMEYTYAAMMEWDAKYLVKDRTTDLHYESPQQAIMLIGMCLHQDEKLNKVQYALDFYDAVSNCRISLPTPIMAGVRTPTRQFSSCVLIECADNLDSINATSNAIVKYVSQRAGIGINAGAIRGLGSPIRDGAAVHTGCIPFFKHFQTAVKSCSQGGVRGGAATLFYPFWHSEVESFLVLKNNRGTEDNRVRHLDYGVQFSKLAYERMIQDKDISLFSPNQVPDLYDAFFAPEDVFRKAYEAYEADVLVPRKTIKAKDLWSLVGNERSSTGRIYIQNVDHCNVNSPFDWNVSPVKQSNLCVAPETEILTDVGYIPIGQLEGEQVTVWNGKEWSNVEVVKTGSDQTLVEVVTDFGHTLECTEYHKFYVQNDYKGSIKEKRAHELRIGDKLIKTELPVIQGNVVLDKAYTNGFFSADGCRYEGRNIIYLYHAKMELKDFIEGVSSWKFQESQSRMVAYNAVGLQDKFFVPDACYTIESRLQWLAGYLDGDGVVARNGTNHSIQCSSTEYEFLRRMQLMLQTLGVNSKVCPLLEEGMRVMPTNDGTGGSKEYLCRQTWRLLITSNGLFKLSELGFKTNRLKWDKRLPQRDAERFVTVKEVNYNGRKDDTYCVREPKRGMVMFNGILTGNCLEVVLPTTPLDNINDEKAEIALCTLAAFNLAYPDTIEQDAKIIVRALDNLLDYQDYPVIAAEKNKLRRTLGVGVVNYAYWLAKNCLKYSDGSANNSTHELFETIQYSLLKASAELAEEKGKCEWFDKTTYASGVLPIDRYSKSVDDLVSCGYVKDWEGLRQQIKQHGLRNSTLTALMPSETSSKISNATNGIEPVRSLVTTKGSKDSYYKQVVPEIDSLGKAYEPVWSTKINKGYLSLVAIMQKFVDQTISANTNYDPRNYPDGKVPLREVLGDIFYAYKMGVKTLYYHNTRDGAGEDVEPEDLSCESGACKI